MIEAALFGLRGSAGDIELQLGLVLRHFDPGGVLVEEQVAERGERFRVDAVAASFDGAFWLAGGANLVSEGDKVERRYLKDAYRYNPEKGWKRVADLPYAVVAAPSPSPADGAGFYVLGGEARPGVRSPEVWGWAPGNKE